MVGAGDATFIANAGACLASRNVLEGRARVRWMVREKSKAAADNGWRVFSAMDDSEFLNTPGNLQVVAFDQLCQIEPALIGIYDLPVGSDLQIVDDGQRIAIVDTRTGRELGVADLYVPGNPVRDWGADTPRPARG
jgi:hypothetical protein